MGRVDDNALQDAKDRLRIPDLWRRLNLPGEPRLSCGSPFRDDRHPSFSIYDDGRHAKDHATGEDFDGPEFLRAATGLPIGEAIREFVKMAGDCVLDDGVQITQPAPGRRHDGAGHPDLSKFSRGTTTDLETVARDRGGLDIGAVKHARDIGCLKFGLVGIYSSWVLTDPRAWIAEGRRLGRGLYPAYGELQERKVHTIKGSIKNWPVGLGVKHEILNSATLIAMVEGGPDYLAAWHFILRSGRKDVIPVTILGRGIRELHPDAEEILAGRRIKFFPHVDDDEGGLELAARITYQLKAVKCRSTYFDFEGLFQVDGQPVKDMNDLVQLDPCQAPELADLFA